MSKVAEEPSMDDALRHKEEGNKFFSDGKYTEAISCYSCGLKCCPPNIDLCAVLYRNRAACYLKKEQWKKAVSDSSAALVITPNESKALFRRAQAYEKLGKAAEAFRDVKLLLHVDPKNKAGIELASHLRNVVSAKVQSRESTEGAVSESFLELCKPDSDRATKLQMAKNIAILAGQEGGAAKIFQNSGIPRILSIMNEDDVELAQPLLRALASICEKHKARASAVVHEIGDDRFKKLISNTHGTLAVSAAYILHQAVEAFTGTDKTELKGSETALVTPPMAEVRNILKTSFGLMKEKELTSEGRDAMVDLVVQVAGLPGVTKEISHLEGVTTLLEVAAGCVELVDGKTGLASVSDVLRMHVAVALGNIYDNVGKDKTQFKKECALFICPKLVVSDLDTRIQGAAALSAVVQGCSDLGNDMLARENVLPSILKMAQSDNLATQLVATEALAHAAGDKSRCTALLGDGVEALKTLFTTSSNDRVRIRALVALCKMASTHGGNVNAKTFVEGAGRRLGKQCRTFLVAEEQTFENRKWAAEGMAFLTLDAEVKEDIVKDKPALQALFELAKHEDKSLLYGVSTALVNLTNSYDKPDKNEELEKLGEFAGENVPQEHVLDDEDFVTGRIDTLIETGVVPAIVQLATQTSHSSREQLCRVLNALAAEQKHRGTVVQQGGAKVLIPMALEGTAKGMNIAAQALAKIGITTDPRLAFPGQRSLEVVRPLIRLLRADQGLQQFEALMALTNLASTSDDHRKRIMREKGFTWIEHLMFEEHEMLRRAATECVCNMVFNEEVFELYAADTGDKVKLLTLFSGEEDVALAKAAAGALAILAADKRVCEKIMAVKSAVEIVHHLMISQNPELAHRGMHLMLCLVAYQKESAEKMIENNGLEILLAFVQKLVPSSPDVQKAATQCLQTLQEYGLIESSKIPHAT
ncbi:protein unc-45 homolog B-like [Sycon ciliatum]|uniref:protein unc-45 homolog B-like n=1 Tax=Sycon ciliatum TaxID=27933 RepID=UPI0031F6F193